MRLLEILLLSGISGITSDLKSTYYEKPKQEVVKQVKEENHEKDSQPERNGVYSLCLAFRSAYTELFCGFPSPDAISDRPCNASGE